jgi:hypothetical protein
MSLTELEAPEVGQLVRARGQQWVVSALRRSNQPVDDWRPDRSPAGLW